MNINISELLKGNIETLPFNVSFNEDVLERDDFKLKLKSPISISGIIYYDDEIVNIKGKISLVAESQCSRCLTQFDNPMVVEFDENFSKDQKSDDFYPILDDNIDLKNMVIDNLIIWTPLKPLCSENCKGLCPICGKNLNYGQCNCKIDNVDPRLLSLKDFFKSSQGGGK